MRVTHAGGWTERGSEKVVGKCAFQEGILNTDRELYM